MSVRFENFKNYFQNIGLSSDILAKTFRISTTVGVIIGIIYFVKTR